MQVHLLLLMVADWAVLDASYPKSGNTAHMGLNDIYELCSEYPNKKIVAAHMYDDTRKTIRQDIPNLMIPDDGEIFEL